MTGVGPGTDAGASSGTGTGSGAGLDDYQALSQIIVKVGQWRPAVCTLRSVSVF